MQGQGEEQELLSVQALIGHWHPSGGPYSVGGSVAGRQDLSYQLICVAIIAILRNHQPGDGWGHSLSSLALVGQEYFPWRSSASLSSTSILDIYLTRIWQKTP